MSTLWIALLVFMMGYMINIFYITVLYHRGLTHHSVILRPWVVKWIGWTGAWVTGIDPKAWACLHRLHHLHSDTEKDPHSPKIFGVFGVAREQVRSYETALRGLIRNKEEFVKIVSDIPFDVNFLNRKRLWLVPYFLHLALGISIGALSHSWLIGAAYFLGIVSHPVQGWMVNALAHKYGYRNFPLTDDSTNNIFVSLLVFGEGYQNNHHALPMRPNFAVKPMEIDFGYGLCLVAERLGLLRLRKPLRKSPLERIGS